MNVEEIVEFLENTLQSGEISPHKYSVVYHSEEFVCELPENKLKDYARISAAVYMELKKLMNDGKVTRRDFETEQDEVEKTMRAFADDGFLDTENIQRKIYEIAIIRNLDIKTAAWMFIYRPGICSAIYTTAEGMARSNVEGQKTAMLRLGKKLNDREWTLYFSDYLMRSLLKVEFANH